MITYILLSFIMILSVVFASVAYSARTRKNLYEARFRPTPLPRPTQPHTSNQN